MPIPTPNQGEHEKEFIQRCMTDDKMVSEYPDTDQRYTVCRTQIKGSKQLPFFVPYLINIWDKINVKVLLKF